MMGTASKNLYVANIKNTGMLYQQKQFDMMIDLYQLMNGLNLSNVQSRGLSRTLSNILRWSFFEKIVNGFQLLTICAKSSVLDV